MWFVRLWGVVDFVLFVGEDICVCVFGVLGVLLLGWGCVCVVFVKLGVGRLLFFRLVMILVRIFLVRFFVIFVFWVVNFCV